MSKDNGEPGMDTAIWAGTFVGSIVTIVVVYRILRSNNMIHPLY